VFKTIGGFEVREKEFEKLYDKYFDNDCPPSEGNKEKILGCYNEMNDYGHYPKKENCIKCWKKQLLLMFNKE
jgi:hypothetical protein